MSPDYRVGHGLDAHRLTPGRALVIGGVAVPLTSLPDWALHLSAYFPGRYAGSPLWVEVSAPSQSAEDRPVRVGDTMTDEKASDAVKALFATGFFRDVRLEAEGDVLVVFVEERPAIASIDITGAKEFDRDTLRKTLRDQGLAESRIFDRAVLERARVDACHCVDCAASAGAISRSVHISSASAATCPSTVALPAYFQIERAMRTISTSSRSWSPGTTGRLKRALSMPTK